MHKEVEMKGKFIGLLVLVGLIACAVPAQAATLLWEDQFNDGWPSPGWNAEWMFAGENYGPGYLTGTGEAWFTTGATQMQRSRYAISDGPKTMEVKIKFPDLGEYTRAAWWRDGGVDPGGPIAPPRVEMFTLDGKMQIYITDVAGAGGFYNINGLADWTEWNVLDIVIAEQFQRVYVNGALAVSKTFDFTQDAGPPYPYLYRGGLGGVQSYPERLEADYYQIWDGEHIIPEPGTIALLFSGLLGLLGIARRR
jgi:hypothetical protein